MVVAVHPLSGESSALPAPSVNTGSTNHPLRFVREHAGADVHVISVLDQAGWHLSQDLPVFVDIPLLHLPPYSPALNPVERLWAYLKSPYLSHRAYGDSDDLFNACGRAWNQLTPEQVCSICHTEWIPRKNQS